MAASPITGWTARGEGSSLDISSGRPWVLLPVAKGAVARRRGAQGRLVSRELCSPLGSSSCSGSRIDMDAHEDYVWPRATSELILLPVTGLECVGDRLLAGEVWVEARASREETERSPGAGP